MRNRGYLPIVLLLALTAGAGAQPLLVRQVDADDYPARESVTIYVTAGPEVRSAADVTVAAPAGASVTHLSKASPVRSVMFLIAAGADLSDARAILEQMHRRADRVGVALVGAADSDYRLTMPLNTNVLGARNALLSLQLDTANQTSLAIPERAIDDATAGPGRHYIVPIGLPAATAARAAGARAEVVAVRDAPSLLSESAAERGELEVTIRLPVSEPGTSRITLLVQEDGTELEASAAVVLQPPASIVLALGAHSASLMTLLSLAFGAILLWVLAPLSAQFVRRVSATRQSVPKHSSSSDQ